MKFVNQLIAGLCLACLLLLNLTSNAWADSLEEQQIEAIHPNLSGTELLEKVATEYAPQQTLGYRRGRDILYTQIDNHNGVLEGIYTGYSIKVDPNASEPRRIAYEQQINAEHIYPQSKGASGSAKSDLHSLFPSNIRVNSARSNNPFAEISDELTDQWFRFDQQVNTPPSAKIDEYSESRTRTAFEPRESKEGDVARAMFYFYTIYRDQANAADPNFFPSQKATLCQWNSIDPVDDAERERSHLVANYQGNENPFILDSTLADRTYCQ